MRLNFIHDRNNRLTFLWADGLRLYGSEGPLAKKELDMKDRLKVIEPERDIGRCYLCG
jgi:hypothetical protein